MWSKIWVLAVASVLAMTMAVAAAPLDKKQASALQRIDGVGNVEIYGASTREVQIELLDDRLRSHRIDVGTMLGTLRNQNFAISGGYVIDGGRKIYVRSMGRFPVALCTGR